MKRAWRFVKWCFASMGWPEWFLLSGSFCLGAGLAATAQGDEEQKKFWFGMLAIIAVVVILTFMAQGIVAAWNRFKEHDEQVFNILKDKDVK